MSDSFWVGKPREGFTDAAREHKFRPDYKVYVLRVDYPEMRRPPKASQGRVDEAEA